MTDFEEAKAFLMKDEQGTSLYDHLSEVLVKVLSERPNDAVAIFEQLSASVKSQTFPGTTSSSSLVPQSSRVAKYCASISKLHQREVEEGDEEQVEPRPQVIANLDTQATAWEAAGVRLDKQDLFKLQLSLAQLAGSDGSIETLRVWGKLFGRNGDYIVAEGTGPEPSSDDKGESEEDEDPFEEEANKFTYWVCSYAGGPWTKLPAVRPRAILCARQMKRFLTGDLNANVIGYPTFPGQEKELVRATIALINADCALAPKGYFVAGEEGEPVTVDEEFAMPGVEDLSDTSAWEVYGLDFSSLGKVAPVVQEDEEGNQVSLPEGWELQPLREADASNWVARRYPVTLPDAADAKVVLRSVKWPGAYAVACPSSNKWQNLYVGFGYAETGTSYTPPMPPPIQNEFDGSTLKEQTDVTEDPQPLEEQADTEE